MMLHAVAMAANLAAKMVSSTKHAKLRKELDDALIENRKLKTELEEAKETRIELAVTKESIRWLQEHLCRAVTGDSPQGGLQHTQLAILMIQAERHRHFLESLRGTMEPLIPLLQNLREQTAPDSAERMEMDMLLDVYRRTEPGKINLKFL